MTDLAEPKVYDRLQRNARIIRRDPGLVVGLDQEAGVYRPSTEWRSVQPARVSFHIHADARQAAAVHLSVAHAHRTAWRYHFFPVF